MSECNDLAELMEWMEQDSLMRNQKFRDIRNYLAQANDRDATIAKHLRHIEVQTAVMKADRARIAELTSGSFDMSHEIYATRDELEQANKRIAELEAMLSAEFVKKVNRMGAVRTPRNNNEGA